MTDAIVAVALIAAAFSPQAITLQPQDRVRVLTVAQASWLSRWFPGREAMFARIVSCESMWDDDAVGAAGERGRLQIHPMHAARFGYSLADLADPEVNGYVGARLLAEREDGSAWSGNAGCDAWSLRMGVRP